MTELEKKLANIESLKDQTRLDELALSLSQGKYEEAMQDLLKFLGYQDNEAISPFSLIKRGYEKGQEH